MNRSIGHCAQIDIMQIEQLSMWRSGKRSDILKEHWWNDRCWITRNEKFHDGVQRESVSILVEESQRDRRGEIRIRLTKGSQRFECRLIKEEIVTFHLNERKKKQTRSDVLSVPLTDLIPCRWKTNTRIVQKVNLLVHQCIGRECLRRHEHRGCLDVELLSNIQMNVQSLAQKRSQIIHLFCHLMSHSLLIEEISTLFDCHRREIIPPIEIWNECRGAEMRREKTILLNFDHSDSRSVS